MGMAALTTNPFREELMATASTIGTPGKGILAADESTGTIGKRFAGINVENNAENRRAYRELLVTTEGLNEHISGVILFDETARDTVSDGRSMIQCLSEQGILAGIKVDKGPRNVHSGIEGETVTQGLDGLEVRAAEYYEMGCRFAKWRAVLKIDVASGAPSELSIQENAITLARYAQICQAHGLAPIVEPEILMDGDHDLATSVKVNVKVQSAVIKALPDPGLGKGHCAGHHHPPPPDHPPRPPLDQLSLGRPLGGERHRLPQRDEQAPRPPLGRLLLLRTRSQASVLKAWSGKAENVPAAQEA